MIDQETIQRIMETAKIEEVIGEFVSLKKRGSNHIGCCPFHNEKTPSFYVSPSKGIFKCFGCGEAGDVVAFLKKHEHFTYPEALRWLADRYHIDIQEEEMTEEQKERQTERDGLFHVSEFAQKFFADYMYNDEMGRAVGLSYFHGRGLSDEIIKRFGLGFSPEAWTAFTDHARKAGYSDAVLEKTGLTIFKDNEDGGMRKEDLNAGTDNSSLNTPHSSPKRKAYDRFRGRVMFPIYSISGRVLGFSGRILSTEKQAAKYVNSPDSDIYNKSRILYGLYQARSAIAKADKCYLVEGNVDVISMHQSGVENTVASCGTSLTIEQIRLIKRYTLNVTVLYDGDSAGIKAALRAVDLLFAEGMKVRVALFPDGEDPDSYAQKYGSTQLQQFLASHEDNFIMYKTRVLLDQVSGDPIRRAELVSETARSIALVTDLMERQEYIRQCSYLLKVSEDALTSSVAKAIDQNRQKREESGKVKVNEEGGMRNEELNADTDNPSLNTTNSPSNSSLNTPHSSLTTPPEAERHLVQLLLNYGNTNVLQSFKGDDGKEQQVEYTVAEIIISDLKNDGLSFTHPLCQRIYEQCALMLDLGRSIDTNHFISNTDEQLRTFAAGLMMDTYSVSESWFKLKNIHVPTIEENLRQDLHDTLLTFKQQRIMQILHDKTEELRGADIERQGLLLNEINYYSGMARTIGSALNQVIAPRIE